MRVHWFVELYLSLRHFCWLRQISPEGAASILGRYKDDAHKALQFAKDCQALATAQQIYAGTSSLPPALNLFLTCALQDKLEVVCGCTAKSHATPTSCDDLRALRNNNSVLVKINPKELY